MCNLLENVYTNPCVTLTNQQTANSHDFKRRLVLLNPSRCMEKIIFDHIDTTPRASTTKYPTIASAFGCN